MESKIQRYKRELDIQKSKRDRLIGKIDSLKEQLADMGCMSLEEGDARLDKMEIEIENLVKERDEKFKKFDKKYKDLLWK